MLKDVQDAEYGQPSLLIRFVHVLKNIGHLVEHEEQEAIVFLVEEYEAAQFEKENAIAALCLHKHINHVRGIVVRERDVCDLGLFFGRTLVLPGRHRFLLRV